MRQPSTEPAATERRPIYEAIVDQVILEHIIERSRKCLCGAPQNADGTLPCGH